MSLRTDGRRSTSSSKPRRTARRFFRAFDPLRKTTRQGRVEVGSTLAEIRSHVLYQDLEVRPAGGPEHFAATARLEPQRQAEQRVDRIGGLIRPPRNRRLGSRSTTRTAKRCLASTLSRSRLEPTVGHRPHSPQRCRAIPWAGPSHVDSSLVRDKPQCSQTTRPRCLGSTFGKKRPESA